MFVPISMFISATVLNFVFAEMLPKPEKIVSGNSCSTSDFPYIVSIKVSYSLIHICGGSLLNERNVLSAAHCAEPYNIYFVMTGQSNFLNFNEDIQISEVGHIFVHPHYDNASVVGDIAIFRLKQNIVETSNTKYITLPQPDLPFTCGEVDVAGWGRLIDESITKAFPLQLQCVSLPVISEQLCQVFYSKTNFVISSQFCTIDPLGRHGVCQGDSGGPLMCRNVQYGIVSWGIGCAGILAPTVHTNVSRYLRFISETLTRRYVFGKSSTVSTPRNYLQMLLIIPLLIT